VIDEDDHDPMDGDPLYAERTATEDALQAESVANPRQWGVPYVQEYNNRRERMNRFLDFYAKTGRMMHACRYAGIAKSTFYDWKARDPLFADEVKEAEDMYHDDLLQELRRRAIIGVRKIKHVSKDGQITYDIEANDQLFAMELKRIEPGFRDRVDVTSGDQSIAGILVVPPKVTLQEFVDEAERLRQEFQKKGYM
jgi:hypothetical protein